jgi:hypothetical protein
VRKPSSNARKSETSVVENANKNARNVRGFEISRGRSDTRIVTVIGTGIVAATHETGTEAMIEIGIEIVIVMMTDIGMTVTRRSLLFLQN